MFSGDQWSSDPKYDRIRNLFIDFFRGDRVEKIHLKALDHVISFSVSNGKIYMRSYAMQFMKSGSKCPNVRVFSMGPHMDLSVRRSTLASDDMWKAACRQPAAAKVKKVKNISRTSLGDKVGRIHMKKQNLEKMAVRRISVLRNSQSASGLTDKSQGKKRARDGSGAPSSKNTKRSKSA